MRRLNQKGQGMTEYVFIVALIVVAIIGAVKFFGPKNKISFNTAADSVAGAVQKGIDEGKH